MGVFWVGFGEGVVAGMLGVERRKFEYEYE